MRCWYALIGAGLLTAAWIGGGWGEATPAPAAATPAPLVERAAGDEGETVVFTPEQVVALALGRDALVRDAQQAVLDAQAGLGVARAHIPQLRLDSGSSASSSAGLDPQSEISGTDFSSQYYNSTIAIPFGGGLAQPWHNRHERAGHQQGQRGTQKQQPDIQDICQARHRHAQHEHDIAHHKEGAVDAAAHLAWGGALN